MTHSQLYAEIRSLRCSVPDLPNSVETIEDWQDTILHVGRINYNKAIDDILEVMNAYEVQPDSRPLSRRAVDP